MVNVTENGGIKEKTAVALGIFDGVHCGHRLVISSAVKYAEKGFTPAVFTFRTESVSFKHGRPFEYIYTNEQKLRILGGLGVKYVMSPDFNALQSMDGEEFVCEALCGKMNAGAVVCGENFRFGKSALYGAEELKRLGEKYGFEVRVIKLSGNGFSSEKYRSMLREGRVNETYSLGCGMYSLYGEVIEGNRLGRTLDFPTINQIFGERQLVPRRGVYHTFTNIDGKAYNSVTNIGVKPTIEKNIKPLAETHILDYSGDLYGRKIEVGFIGFVRDEKKFDSIDELKKQVFADIAYIREQNAGIAMQKPAGKE